MKFAKLIVFFSLVAVLAILLIVFFSQRYQSPEKRFESFVISPIPLEIENIECVEKWQSVDPEFYFRFKYTEKAYQLLLNQRKFKNTGSTINNMKMHLMPNLKVLENFDANKKHFHYITHDNKYIYYLVSTI